MPVLEHIASAGIDAEAITLVCPTTTSSTAWIDELPDEFDSVRVEVHNPKDRRRLSYLATSSTGRRLYLNRTIVDADQAVVLTGRRFDPWLGRGGARGAIFPALADEATRDEALSHLNHEDPGREIWPLRQAAIEAVWLLGQPFYVQLIAAASDGIAHVVAGASDACREAERLLDAAWSPRIARRADTVVAALSGDPRRQTFADLASALAAAARVVRPAGRVILLSDAPPLLGPGADLLSKAEEPEAALAMLAKAGLPDAAAFQWAQAAAHARLSILGRLPDETVEELFASPLASASQVQRLVSAGGECLVLQDAQHMMAVIE